MKINPLSISSKELFANLEPPKQGQEEDVYNLDVEITEAIEQPPEMIKAGYTQTCSCARTCANCCTERGC